MARYRDLGYRAEYEFEDEFEYEAPPPALRIRIVHGRSWGADGEFEDEADFFDPVPPPAGARLLTRFAFGGASLTATHRRMIVQLAKDLLRDGPKGDLECLDVTIVGHEDELGEPARFGALGQRRAEAVTKALADEMQRQVARLPVASRPRGRFVITVQTLGPTRPMRSNLTADGRALNRRVEVTVGRAGLCPDAT